MGVGYARRRKGEKRGPELGIALAGYRALADAAECARDDGISADPAALSSPEA
ncbi:hypothetical protein [Streptomyces sp. NPDC054783]